MHTLYEDKLQELITLSIKTLKIYNELYKLEINNQKNKDEYKKNLNYLNLLIELENEIYSNLKDKDINLYINIIKETDYNLKLSDFSLVINDINNSYFLKRILNNLRLENNRRLINHLQKEFNDDMVNSLLLDEFILEDIINIYIFETEITITKTKNIDYKNSLKMIKYIFSYLNKHIENNLKYNFNIPNKLYLFSKQIANQYEISDVDYKKKLNNHYMEYINREISLMGKEDIYNYSYAHLEYKKILQINLIKSFLSIYKDNILLKRKIYDKIKENIIDSPEILSYYNKNIISLELERLNVYESNKRF